MKDYQEQAEKLADDTVRNLKAEPELIEKLRKRIMFAYWSGVSDRNEQAQEELNILTNTP